MSTLELKYIIKSTSLSAIEPKAIEQLDPMSLADALFGAYRDIFDKHNRTVFLVWEEVDKRKRCEDWPGYIVISCCSI